MQITRQLFISTFALALLGLVPFEVIADDYLERVAAEHSDDSPSGNVTAAAGKVRTERRDYATIDGERISGYLARPRSGSRPFPAVILIHEWWGLNDNIRAMARRFANAGYVALAVDLYEGEWAQDPERARELMQTAMNRESRLERNLEQAYHYLDLMPSTGRVGVVGWCFGGGWSLRTALSFPRELDASVIYYGELITEAEQLEPLQVPLLGHFGSEDEVVPPESVQAFEATLSELDKTYEIHSYEGAGHAFANPSGERYDEAAASRAWQRTLDFLARHLRE